MGYRVIENFSDMLCGGFEYKVGDSYPDHKFDVSAARIAALASNNNKLGRPLIKEDAVKVKPEVKAEPVSEVAEVAEVTVEKPKRGRRKKD